MNLECYEQEGTMRKDMVRGYYDEDVMRGRGVYAG
jgi:hypothetical protein